MTEGDLLQRARQEAKAIVDEAQDQASRLLIAAEAVRSETGVSPNEVESARRELEQQIQGAIDRLTEILNQLRST